jgi:hypothetical protein
MRNNNLSCYQIIANSLSVMEIAEPITESTHPECTIEDYGDIRTDPFDDPFVLIRDENHIYGYLTTAEELQFVYKDPSLRKITKVGKGIPITPECIVPESMPLIELPGLFEKKSFYFVLNNNNITHYVSFSHIDALPMKLCIFSLIIELEANILEVFHNSELTPKVLEKLPKGRLEKAYLLAKERNRVEAEKNWESYKKIYCELDGEEISKKEIINRLTKNPPEDLLVLQATNLIDKKTMLMKTSELFKMLPFESKKEFVKFFSLLETIRNRIAHSDSIVSIVNRAQFNNFMGNLQKTIRVINNYNTPSQEHSLKLIKKDKSSVS